MTPSSSRRRLFARARRGIGGAVLVVACLGPWTVSCSNPFDVSLGKDTLQAELVADVTRVCHGGCVTLRVEAAGGYPPYEVNWSPQLGAGRGPHRVCPTETQTYRATIDDQQPQATPAVHIGQRIEVQGTCLDGGMDARVSADARMSAADGNTAARFDAAGSKTDAALCGLCVTNRSFEGQPGYSRPPPPYRACQGTPDTLPVPNPFTGPPEAGLAPAPLEGQTYLGMITGPFHEVTTVELCSRLEPARTYPFAIDLAVQPRNEQAVPATFEIWGGGAPCERSELLGSISLPASADSWTTYRSELTPDGTHTHLTLRATGSMPGYVIADRWKPCGG